MINVDALLCLIGGILALCAILVVILVIATSGGVESQVEDYLDNDEHKL